MREDCENFEWHTFTGCCNRQQRMGSCALSKDNQMCRKDAEYCKYKPKEDTNVHPEKP